MSLLCPAFVVCCLGSSSEDSCTTTETDDAFDVVVSCSSARSRKKKRDHEIANDVSSHRGETSIHNKSMSDEEKQKRETEVSHKMVGERGQRKKKITSKENALLVADIRTELRDSQSDEEQNKRTKSGKISDDTEVDDGKIEEEAPGKITAQKIEDDADSIDSLREEKVLRKTNTFEEKISHEIDEHELSGVSSSEDQFNEEQDQGNASNHANLHRNEGNTHKTKLTKKSKVQCINARLS